MRSLALALGWVLPITVALLLSTAFAASRVTIHGTVEQNFRGTYDLLVRPHGARTGLEVDRGLVRPDFLDGISGGISLSQWRAIQAISEVGVAAPIEYLGYVLPGTEEPIPLSGVLPARPGPGVLYRVSVSWTAHHGLDVYPPQQVYVLFVSPGTDCSGMGLVPPDVSPEQWQSPPPRLVCFEVTNSGGTPSYRPARGSEIAVVQSGRLYVRLIYQVPFLVAAIDPVEEDKLVGLAAAQVSGEPLKANETYDTYTSTGAVPIRGSVVPVIVSARPHLDETLQLRAAAVQLPNEPVESLLDRLRGWAGPPYPGPNDAYRTVTKAAATPTGSRSEVTVAQLYSPVVERLLHPADPDAVHVAVLQYITTSPVQYHQGRDHHLVPVMVVNSPAVLSPTAGISAPPIENAFGQYRTLTSHDVVLNSIGAGAGAVRVQGTFDADLLNPSSGLGRVSLDGYFPPTAAPGDAATRALLGGQPYGPTRNLGGVISQPPLMLTTLTAAQGLTSPEYYHGANHEAPISAIRVRVAGITTFDQATSDRVSAIAAEIIRRTGLDVDVVLGSSLAPQLIDLRSAVDKRPLVLEQGWSKKGVALTVLGAIDRTSVALTVLVLLSGGLFVLNTVATAMRARRRELATLSCLGWRRWHLLSVSVGTLAVIGALAGGVSAALAYVVAWLVGLSLSPWLAAAAIPTAIVMACLVGAIPAWRTAGVEPVQALDPAGGAARRNVRTRAGSVIRLGITNIRRSPGRATATSAGLAVAVAGATILSALSNTFTSTVSGSLLGNLSAEQARGVELAATVVVLGLGAAAVADVVYLNMLDRRAELATLRACGWPQAALRTLLLSEAWAVTLLGCLVGAVAGGVTATVLHAPLGATIATALVTMAAAAAAGLLASLLPVHALGRRTPIAMLTAE